MSKVIEIDVSSLSRNAEERAPSWEVITRRGLELFISLAVLALTSPVLGLIVFLLWKQGEGPVFFLQERVGLGGKVFWIIKFRTMYLNAEDSGPIISTSYQDERITPVGRFLRRTKLDEIPQLINVLKGEMALVGPRPERPYFHEKFRSIPGWDRRLSVKPGVTGPAQIDNQVGHDATKKIVVDLRYLSERSLRTDLRILVDTARYLFSEL